MKRVTRSLCASASIRARAFAGRVSSALTDSSLSVSERGKSVGSSSNGGAPANRFFQ
jgi:hypothetical protein